MLRVGVALVAIVLLPAASAAPGGLVFGAVAPLDPARTAVQPNLAADGRGDLWASGATLSGVPVLRRSADEGQTFRAVSPPPLQTAGDVALSASGGLRLAAVADAATVVTAASDDDGASWRTGALRVAGTLDDRLSLARDGETTFLALRRDGAAYVYSSADGVAYEAASAGGGPVLTGTRCGALRFDPVRRNLYLPCSQGSRVAVAVGHLAPGQRSGIAFRETFAPASADAVAGLPSVAVDAAGTLYAVWASGGPITYASSADDGATWGAPIRVGGGAATNALPAALGGADGRLAIAWLGTASPVTATSRWYGYAAVVSGAASSAPRVAAARFTSKPIHLGRIPDPRLGDYLELAPNRHGGLVLAFDDTTNQQHASQLSTARQLAGPTVLGGSIVEPTPNDPVADPAGDAAPAALDLTGVAVAQDGPTRLRVRLSLAAPPAEAPEGSIWLARFQVLSTDARGAPAYRILYAGARARPGEAPAFFGGTTACADTACRALSYPALGPATGRVQGTSLEVVVPLANGFGPRVALNGDLLYGITGISFAGGADVDSTGPFDHRLEQRIGRTTSRGAHVVGSGAIAAGRFSLDVFQQRTGRVAYRDARGRVRLVATRITRVRLAGRRRAVISAVASVGGRSLAFTVTATDGGAGRRRDSFAIRAGSYRRSGRLLSGDVRIR